MTPAQFIDKITLINITTIFASQSSAEQQGDTLLCIKLSIVYTLHFPP